MGERLIDIRGLSVSFEIDEGILKAVDNVSFYVDKGETVGLVGESGCGKSVTALSLLRLIPSPPGSTENGSILFNSRDILKMDPKEIRKIRGRAISMIFQEPSAALSPLLRIGNQMIEVLQLHSDISKKEAWEASESWLRKVGIPDAGERMFAYPYQLSGGMQQRIMIAMALMMQPELIIADEPTTALDVTIQAQVFDLIREMRQLHTALLLITHDMGVIWEMCDRVIVMYASRIVEEGSREDIFDNPAHPYTKGLLDSIPRLSGKKMVRLKAIPGNVPSPLEYPSGCHFRDRCVFAFERCAVETPSLELINQGHSAACFLLDNERTLSK
jgi:oligopeptide/dipeptide ABC transporter ATP-binding protein